MRFMSDPFDILIVASTMQHRVWWPLSTEFCIEAEFRRQEFYKQQKSYIIGAKALQSHTTKQGEWVWSRRCRHPHNKTSKRP